MFLTSSTLVLLLHVVLSRVNLYFNTIGSGQKLLMVVFTCVLMVDLCLAIFIWDKSLSVLEIAYFFTLVILSFYIYFHVFNMSETARRIKLLIDIHQGSTNNPKKISQQPFDAIQIRVDRLKVTNQVYEEDGHYFIKNRLLLFISKFVAFIRLILGFRRNE